MTEPDRPGARAGDDEPHVEIPGQLALGSDMADEDLTDDEGLLDEYGGPDVVRIPGGDFTGREPADAEDVMLDSWSDDDDALGTESGGFGPDRPRDAAMPGIYSSDEIDDVSAPGDVHDDNLVGQGEDGGGDEG
jgi:hypothetical protein